MTKINQIYKCNICGNVVEVLHTGIGTLVCCGKEMKLFLEKDEDEGKEKHVPIIEKITSGLKVKVGSTEHPMEDNHYIEWIEIIANDKSYKQFLKPRSKPEAEFNLKVESKDIKVRAYCNLHGLWKSQGKARKS